MRVLMVSDVYFPRINGVSTAIQTYHDALADQGVEVRLVAPSYDTDCRAPWVTRIPSRSVPRDPEDRLVSWREMRKAVMKEAAAGCDLIHIQTPFIAHYIGYRVARHQRLPVMATYHTLFEEYLHHYAPLLPASWLRSAAKRFSRSQCNALDAVIVPSRAIHDRLGEYGVTTPRHILPTGIPLHRFGSGDGARFRAVQGIAPDRPVALYVGRVAHEKNIDFLLEMIQHARADRPDLLLVIAGEGPALQHLRERVREQCLGGNVLFVGYLDRQHELPDCYSAANLFVFASRTETQGLVLLEAMAMGVPVVALAAMGTVDILSSKLGAITPPDDPQAFALAVVGLLNDPARCLRLSAQARAYAQQWSDQALAKRMAALYAELIQLPVGSPLNGKPV